MRTSQVVRIVSLFRSFILFLFVLVGFVGCAGFGGGGTTTPSTTKAVTPDPTAVPQVSLATLHWCSKPILIFRDEGATQSGTPTATATASTSTTPTVVATVNATPQTITDWKQVEPNLGFTVFLPPTLPQGTCLISASGTIHDPTFGGIFTIGYILPDHDAISLSEAPLTSQNSTFQCSPSTSATVSTTPTPVATTIPVQLCTGARSNTNIVLSERGTQAELEKTFDSLQSNVTWVPVN